MWLQDVSASGVSLQFWINNELGRHSGKGMGDIDLSASPLFTAWLLG